MYSFVVISYNEENYILEALESIRFQIEKYGDGRSYQLIVADDCSKDLTQDYIDCWLETNKNLFAEITKLFQPKNVGTNANMVAAMRKIHGSLFYSIAGDDMLAHTDIFRILENNKNIDVLSSASLIVLNGKIVENRKKYADILAQSFYTSSYIRWSVGLGCPIQAGAIWNKRMNKEVVLSYMQKLHLLDDRPRFYSIWKNERNITYKYVNIPMLLHRKNINSVSSLAGKHIQPLNQDLTEFYNMVIDESDNVFYKILAYLQKKSVLLRQNGKIRYMRYITPYYMIEQTRRILHNARMKEIYNELEVNYMSDNKTHIVNLRKNAERLKKTYENRKVPVSATW